MSVAKEKYQPYTDSQTPCLITRKECGCCIAACVLDDTTFEELAKAVEECSDADEMMEESSLLEQIVESRRRGALLEVQPVSFVRTGGLNFDCQHPAKETVEVGKGPDLA